MGSADQGIVEAIMRARMQGRGPDSMQAHNPEWFGYKNYPEIFDAMDSGASEGYMLDNTPDDTLHQFGKYAQYQGMPQAPDVPSARDVRSVGRGDPEMRRRFEEHFGTDSLNRADQGVAQNDRDYVPAPRPRPSTAPIGPTTDEYEGDQSGMTGPFRSRENIPRPEEAYSYMPGLRDRVIEQQTGGGPSRDLKSDRYDGTKFDRAMAPFAGQETGNIQDYRMMAIENMLKRGGGQVPPDPEVPQEMSPSMSSEGLDEMLQQHFDEMRQEQLQNDPELADFARRRRQQ